MVGYIILGSVALFLAVILIRAAMFRPKKQPPVSQEAVSFDQDSAVEALAELVRCKTISYSDPSLERKGVFFPTGCSVHGGGPPCLPCICSYG